MAERRMFAKTIVLSDAFLDMPMSARCLYFTLGMFADDDGFVNAPKAIMRQCGASEDDMRVLIARKFVILFESGVIVIKHWRINNYLRSDRYTETKHIDEKNSIVIESNGAYHLRDEENNSGIPPGIPNNGIPSIGKDSIGKNSIDKNNKTLCANHPKDDDGFYPPEEDADSLFEELWKMYPNKKGKGAVSKTKKKELLKVGKEQMIRCIERYIHDHDELQRSGKFCPEWKNGSTFFNSGYVDYLDENYESADSNGNNVSTEIYGGDRQ